MPRERRQDSPGVVHHVWARGIDGRAIFHDDGDRQDLLHRLERVLPESGMRCFAWALMSNHVHLVLQTGTVALSTVMMRIHTGFALRFNRLNERRGYLFQSRFGSRVVKNDSDLLAVIAYVLRNPLEGGLVRDASELERYPWSSYGALIGRRDPLEFESISATLAFFGDAPQVAGERLRAWIAREPPPRERPFSLDELIRETCLRHAAAEVDVRAGRRTSAAIRARAEISRRAVFELELRASVVARSLGLSRSAISQMLRRGGPPA